MAKKEKEQVMPDVNGTKYPYTKAGMAAAKKAKSKKKPSKKKITKKGK
jgi:hypothetical protein